MIILNLNLGNLKDIHQENYNTSSEHVDLNKYFHQMD